MSSRTGTDRLAIVEEPIQLRDSDMSAAEEPLPIESALADQLGRLAQHERALTDQESEHLDEMAHVLMEMIEISDAFERIFGAAREMDDRIDNSTRRWLGNFRTIHDLVRKTLSDRGVAEIETLSRTFDPHWHRAVEATSESRLPDGSIAEIVRRGYVWHGRILRKTEVVVVRHGSSPTPGRT
jgi:molecular chaperone GrpE